MKGNRILATSYFVLSLCFYVLSLFQFIHDGSLGIVYLGLGSAFLSLGAVWLNKGKEKKDGTDGESKDTVSQDTPDEANHSKADGGE